MAACLSSATPHDDPPPPPPPLLPSSAVPLRPRSAFEALPDALHANIATLLTTPDQGHLGVTSGNMHRLYGTGIANLTLGVETGDRQYNALASLLQQQTRLKSIYMGNSGALLTVLLAIAQGHCLCLQKLELSMYDYTLSIQEGQYLVVAVETEGALPALKELYVSAGLDATMIVALTDVMGLGSLPLMKSLALGKPPYSEAVMTALTAMLEARATLPNCQRLEALWGSAWLENGSEAVRVGLLRALLRSVYMLRGFTWLAAYEECFRDLTLTHVQDVHFWIRDATPSGDVLKAMPALQELWYGGPIDAPQNCMAVLPSILSALQHGAGLQHLRKSSFCGCLIDDAQTLQEVPIEPCLPCLVELHFDICYFGPQGIPALAEVLQRDAFPSLKKVYLTSCPTVGDEGVVRLAQALLASSRTRLAEIWLEYVEMGDPGMIALANLVRQDRCRALSRPKLSDHYITDEGVLALAEAIAQGPIWDNLRCFHLGLLGQFTSVGIGVLVFALLHKCPNLIDLRLEGDSLGPLGRRLVEGMLRAAGRHMLFRIGFGNYQYEEQDA